MKRKRLASSELLTSIDVLNTLNGGTSEHQLKVEQFSNHREVRVRAPGVNEENMKAEINNNILSVFYTIHLQSESTGIQVPKVVYSKPIPYFVDVDKITAAFENDFFTVRLPYNSLAQGYHRTIPSKN